MIIAQEMDREGPPIVSDVPRERISMATFVTVARVWGPVEASQGSGSFTKRIEKECTS